jgi:hypothetical protein
VTPVVAMPSHDFVYKFEWLIAKQTHPKGYKNVKVYCFSGGNNQISRQKTKITAALAPNQRLP